MDALVPATQLTREELLKVMENSVYPGAMPQSIELALAYCQQAGLDPLQKPVHIVPMKVKKKLPDGKDEYVDRDVLMPGINRYRVQAVETGDYAGQDEAEFGDMHELMVPLEQGMGPLPGFLYPEWCRITVYRLDRLGVRQPYTVKAYYLENYVPKSKDSAVPNDMWRKRARGQLEKCAEAQALRKAFPERTGAPTADEMAGRLLNDADTIEGTAVERREPSEPQRKSASPAAAPAPTPSPKPAAPPPAGPVQDMTGERNWITGKMKALKLTMPDFLQQTAGIRTLEELTPENFKVIEAAIKQKMREQA